MLLPRRPFLRLFDPREGEDYRYALAGKRAFSSLAAGRAVINYYPGRRARPPFVANEVGVAIQRFLAAAVETSTACGFIAVTPASRRARSAVNRVLGEAAVVADPLFATFPWHAVSLETAVHLQHDPRNYEEWIVGGFLDEPAASMAEADAAMLGQADLEFFLSRDARLPCFSFLDSETGEWLVVAMLFPGIDEELARVRSAAAALAEPAS